jgi:hypothetical protein
MAFQKFLDTMGPMGPMGGAFAQQRGQTTYPQRQFSPDTSRDFNQYPSYVNQGMGQQKPQGLMGKLGQFLGGKPDFQQNVPIYSPQTMNIQNQLAQMGFGGMGDFYQRMMQDPNQAFQPYAEQATKNFYQQTVPGIAERFTGAGGQRSGAFAQQLGSDMQTNLAALGSQFGENRLGMQGNFLNTLMNQGMQRQFEPNVRTNQGGAGQDMAQLIAKLAPIIMAAMA